MGLACSMARATARSAAAPEDRASAAARATRDPQRLLRAQHARPGKDPRGPENRAARALQNAARMNTSRRSVLGLIASTAALGAGGQARAGQTVRIGYQKFGLLVLVKARGELEKALGALGWSVAWAEFPGGIQLVEALQAGKVDFGVLGEGPPIFALAAGAPLVYLGAEPAAPTGEALIVPKDSPLKKVSDLVGKQVVVNKGSNSHYLLVRALDEAKVPYDKVKVTFVPPAGARAAFEAGQVDAWSIWDPFLASVQKATGARVLRDGAGLVENVAYYVGTRDFARTQSALVDTILAEVGATGDWANRNRSAVVDLLAPQIGIDKDALALSLSRQKFGVKPVGPELLASQQRIAEVFHAQKLIPRAIKVAEGRWDRSAAPTTAAGR
jgi:sulfonate transport system substrate-binding protein